ncbi:MAG: helix-turn-helix transcriptional regulator, partial [Phenylobacterium sp.]|nr:helix-turn-helix transcriptional regulator [Phenylobacterium sp.]
APGGVSEDDLIALLGLTRAEARVAVAIAAGATARAAARGLGLSFHTVRHQIQSVIEKSGVGGKVELVAMLARLGGPSDAAPRG